MVDLWFLKHLTLALDEQIKLTFYPLFGYIYIFVFMKQERHF